jgi:hypothetical protein
MPEQFKKRRTALYFGVGCALLVAILIITSLFYLVKIALTGNYCPPLRKHSLVQKALKDVDLETLQCQLSSNKVGEFVINPHDNKIAINFLKDLLNDESLRDYGPAVYHHRIKVDWYLTYRQVDHANWILRIGIYRGNNMISIWTGEKKDDYVDDFGQGKNLELKLNELYSSIIDSNHSMKKDKE